MSKPTTMVDRATAYLAYRRSLGYALRSEGFVVLRFARFADRARHRGAVTPRVVVRWLEAGRRRSPASEATALSAVRSFARHLAGEDGASRAPDSWMFAGRGRRKRPHIFTDEQLGQLMAAAGRLRLQDELGPVTYQTLFGLLASTGLRISEALGVRRGQLDLSAATLLVERGKLHKARTVPLHATVVCAMRRYLLARDRRWGKQPERAIFLGSRGQALSVGSAQDRFRQACDGLGWQCGNGEIARPRLHDLRHTFACRRLQEWYEQGCNVHQHINALAVYLGHSSVASTYWYLTATPAVLGLAGGRFERFASRGDGRSS